MIFVYTTCLILASGAFFDWWTVPIFAAAVAFWRLRRIWRAIPQAFLAGAVGWLLPALWMDAANSSLLSDKVARLFHAPGPWSALAATAVIGGLLAALGAFMGQRLRKLIAS
jgi:hypothetical protein